MVACAVRQFDDLRSAESRQIDTSDTGRIIGIAENPASVDFTIRLRQFRMVKIIPGYKTMRVFSIGLVSSLYPQPFSGSTGEHGNHAQQTTRWQAINAHLTAETT